MPFTIYAKNLSDDERRLLERVLKRIGTRQPPRDELEEHELAVKLINLFHGGHKDEKSLFGKAIEGLAPTDADGVA